MSDHPARIKCGSLIHSLPAGSDRARCGRTTAPGDKVGQRPRAWVLAPGRDVTCSVCKSRASSGFGSLVAKIMEALDELGPMTRSETGRHLGIDDRASSGVFTRLMRATPKHPKRIHIAGWTRDQEGERAYLRAQYAVGDGAPLGDKAKPNTTGKSAVRVVKDRYRTNQKLRVRWVFDLGLTRAQLAAERAKIIKDGQRETTT